MAANQSEEEEQFETEEVAREVKNVMREMAEDNDSSVRVAGNRVSMTKREFVEGVTGMIEALSEEYSDN